MVKSIIVLTTGLSGSSFVTSFLSRAGYWTGDETVIKNNFTGKYDTFENKKLVELNTELINSLSYPYHNDANYHKDAHLLFEQAYKNLDPNKYEDFIKLCDSNGKWLWKDPRLWLTIGFWHSLLDKNRTKVILLSREPLSLWISLQNKRHIISYGFLKKIEKYSRESLANFLQSRNIVYTTVCYDELIRSPEKIIPEMNDFLETELSLSDLEDTYKGELRKPTWTINKLVTAILIYIKNYFERRQK